MKVQAFIGIGSNLGDRLAHCRAALDRLALLPGTTLKRVSPFCESEPQEGVEGGRFLNAVAEVSTSLAPRELLGHLQDIEAGLGRAPDHRAGAARTIDLDILLYGDTVMNDPDLTIPHPRMAVRRFVLAPLVALAPGLRHPVLQMTTTELLRRLGPERPAALSGMRR
ncbi:MAG: 2-amino-4-hydroxy-6-hydroxymethyldihydropteridine diphosphokinase [candidate division NC10 bacterium]|nr:2-amino-4-hydroxy-6-hydroxymethyldihydropteridine diphosphokinase [candidate division NC10 bacterium]MBI4841986.1 2-amino-4-hydroxy-6-hydroxymethyldihydropteridine diphosphokinase [candidate division NC10 bacterium]